jgi:hypothetical protein
MKNSLTLWATHREKLQIWFENFTPEQLNHIPTGFSNNLIWNLGHVLVTQQALVYRLSGLDVAVPTIITETYKKGTRPEAVIDTPSIQQIQQLLQHTAEQTQMDAEKGVFKEFQPYTTLLGFQLQSVEEAIQFNTYHEALHLGIMMQIRKFL